MKKGHFAIFTAILATFMTLSLVSCNNSSSSTSTPNEIPNDYYNEENFVQSDKVVTNSKLVTYEAPSLLDSSERLSVTVNGQDLFVYETRVNHGTKFSWDVPSTTASVVNFDFEGKVHVEVSVLEDVEVTNAVIRPLVYGISPKIQNNVISFDLEYTANYVLEYNDDPNTALHIFANPLETEVMTKEEAESDPNKIYVGPGIYNAGAFPLSDNLEIYLAGGSYVYGQFSGEDFNNIKIYGRGIIAGEIYQRRTESEYTLPVVLRNCSNITINDITILDPAGWAVTIYKCENVSINNIKIITARQNGDGISVQSSSHVSVKGGFVRTWDDSLVVKNADRGTTSDITFDGVTVWTDLAQSMEVGYETNGPTMTDITFKNITVVHNFHKAVISMHNCDDAIISNVKYQNITLEDGQMLGDDRNDGENDFLIDFTIAYNIDWSKSGGARGVIRDVLIENVNVYHMLDTISARFLGESNESNISNVTIKGLKIEGKEVTSLSDIDCATNSYTSNINVEKMDNILGSYISLPYQLDLVDNDVSITNKANIIQEGMLVPNFAYQQGGLPYIGPKNNVGTSQKATHGAGSKTTTPVDDGTTTDFTSPTSSISNIYDGDDSTAWISGDWTNEEKEFAGVTMDFSESLVVGKIRIKGLNDNEYYYTFTIEIWVRKMKSDGTMNDKYVRLSAAKDYEMTPASGNAIDINISAQTYGGIQFRFYRNDVASSPKHYVISEIEFYSPALSYGKAIVDSTAHADVYNVEKAIDGDPTGTSYYESASLPAHIVIDFGAIYNISTIVLCLPPSLNWTARTQNIEFYGSDDNVSYSSSTPFTNILPARDYLFDPTSGNRVTIDLDSPIACRFFKIVINSNDIKAGYGAQLSEISVYGN